jgi:phosphoglycerate dehydrogenase-like enzyme
MKQIQTLFLRCSHFNPDQKELDRLTKTFPELAITMVDESSYTTQQLETAEIVVGFPRPQDLPHAKNLTWLQTPSAGVGPYVDKDLYQNKDIMLTNAVGTFGRQIADHTIGIIIGLNHNLFTYHDQMKDKHWERYFPTSDIWESTILIIGLGDIGSNLAKRAKAHEMHVIAIKRTMTDKPAYVDELYTTDSLDQVLPRADYVVVCTASTPETEGIMDARRISMMKKGSYIINVARGSLVDQEAVIAAIESGHLAGAGFDATEPEPLPRESKLWSLPNVFISPHASGMSPSDPHQVFEIFYDNMKHYLGDRKMRNLVDFDLKY